MPNPLDGKSVALGVTGSIACYKAVDLASKLVQEGALVDVIMTTSATGLVTPLAFQSITHRRVVTDAFDPKSEMGMDHVAIADRADAIVVAPATANTIARMACGLAGDSLTTTVLATRAPVVVAPAMDSHMFQNLATQENVARLRSRGFIVVGPAEGRLASGQVGVGRMVEPLVLVGHVKAALGRHGDLADRKVVVTAGGTREPVDLVRVISNRSSGKMGHAIAEAARDRGATSVLVTAATAISDPAGVSVVHVETTQDMRNAVRRECKDADALIMAAAVADWKSVAVSGHKIKKTDSDRWTLELTKTTDILAEVSGGRLVKVGFAAETEDLLANAQTKLVGKGLHLIVANDITSEEGGFASDTNKVAVLDREGGVEDLPLMSKYEVGHRLLDRVVGLLA